MGLTRDTLHTLTYFHRFDLHYILPTPLAKYGRNLAEYRRISQEHHVHAHLFPPSRPPLYSICPIDRT